MISVALKRPEVIEATAAPTRSRKLSKMTQSGLEAAICDIFGEIIEQQGSVKKPAKFFFDNMCNLINGGSSPMRTYGLLREGAKKSALLATAWDSFIEGLEAYFSSDVDKVDKILSKIVGNVNPEFAAIIRQEIDDMYSHA